MCVAPYDVHGGRTGYYYLRTAQVAGPKDGGGAHMPLSPAGSLSLLDVHDPSLVSPRFRGSPFDPVHGLAL